MTMQSYFGLSLEGSPGTVDQVWHRTPRTSLCKWQHDWIM